MPESGDLPHQPRNNGSRSQNNGAKSGGRPHPPTTPLRSGADQPKPANSQAVRAKAGRSREHPSRRDRQSDRPNPLSWLLGQRPQRDEKPATRSRRKEGLSETAKPSGRNVNATRLANAAEDRQPGLTAEPARRQTGTPRRRDSTQSPDLTPRSTFGQRIGQEGRRSTAGKMPRTASGRDASRPDPSLAPTQLSRPSGLSEWTNRRRARASRDATVLQSEQPTRLQGREPERLGGRRERRTRTPATPMLGNRNQRVPESEKVTAFRSRSEIRSPRKEPTPPPQPRSPGVFAAMYAARMVILSIGVSVLAGTLLSVWDPASRPPAAASSQVSKASAAGGAAQAAANPAAQMPNLGQEIGVLKTALQTLVTQTTAQNAQFGPGVFLLDMDTNGYVDVNGGNTIAAASTIKIPVLIAFFQDVDAGKIRLDEMLTMRKELIGSGSGEFQYLPPNSQFSALEVATKMITISDNTATNMLIARLGGIGAVNQRMQSWGLTTTKIHNLLPDLEGTNLTTPKDLALLMARVSQGELVSMRSRDRLLDIMRKTVTDSLLPQGLGEGATIAHKTGDIGTVIGDAGLIDLPNGKRYAIGVLVKRPFNNYQAGELIRQISRTTYQHFSQPQGIPKSPTSTSPAAPRAGTEDPHTPAGMPVDPGSTAQLQDTEEESQ